MKPVIGILGGMGPAATVLFEQLLVKRFRGADQTAPKIICINDGSIPDRSDYLLGRGADPVPKLIQNVLLLEQAGADVICIPCNTAYAPAILNRVQAATELPILHMPKAVVQFITSHNYAKVCLLATAGTVASKMYQQLCGQENIECLVSDSTEQALVTQIIQAVKAGKLELAKQSSQTLRQILSTKSCDAVILGCTELSIVGSLIVPQSIIATDTLEVLVNDCVAYTKNKSGKELSSVTR